MSVHPALDSLGTRASALEVEAEGELGNIFPWTFTISVLASTVIYSQPLPPQPDMDFCTGQEVGSRWMVSGRMACWGPCR